jgi:hypothetical protein
MSTLNKTINTDVNNIPVTQGVPIPSDPSVINNEDTTNKKEEKIPSN